MMIELTARLALLQSLAFSFLLRECLEFRLQAVALGKQTHRLKAGLQTSSLSQGRRSRKERLLSRATGTLPRHILERAHACYDARVIHRHFATRHQRV